MISPETVKGIILAEGDGCTRIAKFPPLPLGEGETFTQIHDLAIRVVITVV